MLNKQEPSIQRTEPQCMGRDAEGREVFAHHEIGEFSRTVRFDGCIKPTNLLSQVVRVQVHEAYPSGWFVDNELVDLGFRCLSRTWNANGSIVSERRIFESREQLENLLRAGGFEPVSGYRAAEAAH